MDWVQAYTEGRTPWDLTMVTPPLRALLRSGRHLKWGLPADARVAVPGCGRGHDLRAWSGTGLQVTGFDIVPRVVEEARALLEWNRASGEVLCRDVLGLAQEFAETFDLVYDYTCYCALPRYLRQSYLREVQAILKPGGVLLHLAFPLGEVGPNGPDRPPFASTVEQLRAAFGERFEAVDDFEPENSVPERVGSERWFLWRRRT